MTPTTRDALLALWTAWPECKPKELLYEREGFGSDRMRWAVGFSSWTPLSGSHENVYVSDETAEALARDAIERAIHASGFGITTTTSIRTAVEWWPIENDANGSSLLAVRDSKLDALISAANAVRGHEANNHAAKAAQETK